MSMDTPLITVVIPAHNEEGYIGDCLDAVRKAARRLPPRSVQVIVVADKCTDRTAAIAHANGAQVIACAAHCIAAVRNIGAAHALGRILVTIDADSRMTEGALAEVVAMLRTRRYIGGGAVPQFDRMSLGIGVTSMVIAAHLLPTMLREGAALSGAMFWTYKSCFDAIGGFDEHLCSMEDMDFAVRLKRLGDRYGRRYGILREARCITSARKFDRFGDWYLLKNYGQMRAIFTGTDRAAADAFYYDVR